MEVALAASAFTNFALVLLQKYARRGDLEDREGSAEHKAAHSSRESQSTVEENSPTLVDGQTVQSAPEGSIAALEAELKVLRAQAKELNSPDTFVQYARVSREANKVEKELEMKKTREGYPSDPLGEIDFTRLMNGLLGQRKTRAMRSGVQMMVLGIGLRVCVLGLLWWYFSWGPGTGQGEQVVTLDCRAFRPFEFVFRKRMPTCAADDWLCAAAEPQCGVSYVTVTVLGNAVFGMAANGFL